MADARILIVEDERIVAKDIQNRLEAFEYTVVGIASSGDEAIQKTEAARPDLVLMDIVIKGDISGVEAAKQIRERFDIPIVYLTAYADEKTFAQAITSEPYGYIVKPFRDIELITTINTALYKHKTERRLREHERWLAITLKSIGDAVITTDSKGLITFMNSTAEALTGWKQQDALGLGLSEVFNIMNKKTGTQSEDPLMRVISQGVETGLADNTVLLSKNGRELFISNKTAPIRDEKGNITGAVLVFRDITKHKQTEELLRRTISFLELLQKVSAAANQASTVEEAVQFAVIQVCTYIGWPVGHVYLADSANELAPTKIWYLRDPGRFDTFRGITEVTRFSRGIGLPGRVLATGKTVWIMDATKDSNFPRAKQAGDIGLRAAFGFPVLVGTEVVAVLEFFSEEAMEPDEQLLEVMAHIGTQLGRVVERRRAEETLATEKERLAVTLRGIGDGVITIDTGGNVVLINKMGEEITGWTQEEARGRPLSSIFQVRDEKTGEPLEGSKLLSGAVPGVPSQAILTSRAGMERIIASKSSAIIDKNGLSIGTVLAFRDITEQRKIEQELLRTQKLESLGVLAGGIAHDFNNLLTAILGNISLAKMHLNKEDAGYERLIEAEKACIRTRDLTQQLVTFSRGGLPVKKLTSIEELIKDSAIFAVRGSNVRCEFLIQDGLWPVEVDEGQISQVINNLVINAQQAMPGGGTVKVKAENINTHTQGTEHKLPLEDGRYLRITIEDNGLGIPEEHLSKVFDPYFTTKQNGSGLGLATTYSIVKNHNGYIEVASKLGVGTKFFIYLPVSDGVPQDQKVVIEEIIPGSGRILVMDDEEAVRETIGEILEHLGYRVDYACDGGEAVEKYCKAKKAKKPFDAVIMDLTIPAGMSGKEAIQQLLKIDSRVKAIASSGYSDNPVMSEFDKHGFKGVIAKPYNISELSKVLKRVIGEENR